jgi:two-component system cell cycle response regulator DivK
MSRDTGVVVLLVQPSTDEGGPMYAEFLRFHGLTALVASNAADALAAAVRADVIVTGILLSGDVDGVELIGRLRSDATTKELRIIVLTSCAWQSAQDRAELAGCDAFLTKPCLPETLLQEVRRQVAAGRLPRARANTAKADLPHTGMPMRTSRNPKRPA